MKSPAAPGARLLGPSNEPRVRRVIAWDIVTDFYAVLTGAMPPALRSLADNATNAEAQSKFDFRGP